jgi:2-iminobutanoate/2-iminopropanoate deaminase
MNLKICAIIFFICLGFIYVKTFPFFKGVNMISKKGIFPEKIKAIGPYSPGIISDNLIFISGQIPVNPETGNIDSECIKSQTTQVLENIKTVLSKENADMNSILKTTVFLKDINDFNDFNEVYKTYFDEPYPARSAFEVSNLPKSAKIEIEAIAKK